MALFALAASLSSLQAQNFEPTQPANRKAVKTLIAPAALIVAGLISFDWKYAIREERNEDFPHFKTHADDYLQYAPAVAVYGLNWAGIHGKNDLANQTALLIKSELAMTALVQSLKYSTHVVRPDGSDQHSFVSGHTAQAICSRNLFSKRIWACQCLVCHRWLYRCNSRWCLTHSQQQTLAPGCVGGGRCWHSVYQPGIPHPSISLGQKEEDPCVHLPDI